MVIALLLIAYSGICFPFVFALGVCYGLDLKRTHERADIRPALRRSVR